MPVTTMHSAGDYPLANSSRRRRRLAMLRRGVADAPPAQGWDEEDVPEASTESVSAEDCGAGLWAVPSIAALRLDRTESPLPIRELMTRTEPVAWMLAGESFAGDLPESPSLCDFFTRELRIRRKEQRDLVINAGWTGCGLREVHDQLATWLEHRPDVVLILCGSADGERGVEQLGRFEEQAISIIRRCRKAGAHPVLATSPFSTSPEPNEAGVSELVYAEAVRAICTEWDVTLIDLRTEWEQYAIPRGLSGSWFDEQGTGPSAIGMAQMAGLIVGDFEVTLQKGGTDREVVEVVETGR